MKPSTKVRIKKLLKPLVEQILKEQYTVSDLKFEDGLAIIKNGRKIVAKVIDTKIRRGGASYSSKYPYNLEMGVGIRQCTDLQDCIDALNRNI